MGWSGMHIFSVFSSISLIKPLSHLYSGLWEVSLSLESSTSHHVLYSTKPPCASECNAGNSTKHEDRIPAKPSLALYHRGNYRVGQLRTEFPFLQMSQALHHPLIPVFRTEGKYVATGVMISNSWATSLPKERSQALTALPYRKVYVARLDRGAGNLNSLSESELLHKEL